MVPGLCIGRRSPLADGFARLGEAFFQEPGDLDGDARPPQSYAQIRPRYVAASSEPCALDLLLAENFFFFFSVTQRPWTSWREFGPGHRSALARIACQQTRGPQNSADDVYWAGRTQRHPPPRIWHRRDDWLFARPWSVFDCRQRP